MSADHFLLDGTLIEAWAGIKSCKPRSGGEDDRAEAAAHDAASKGRNAERDFPAEKLGDHTHASTPDPEARLFRKGRGKEVKPSQAKPSQAKPSQALPHGHMGTWATCRWRPDTA